jgi:uncharacterized protein YidB (DUF937 family)
MVPANACEMRRSLELTIYARIGGAARLSSRKQHTEGFMSIFDTVKDLIGGGQGGNADADLISHATALVNNPETGGLQGLVQQFHANGLGEAVNSWVGPGGNHQITGDQIQQVLGQDRIAAVASKFGISPEDASAKLAQVLPTVIGKLSSQA